MYFKKRKKKYSVKFNDNALRQVFYYKYPNAITLEEVKFPEFKADIIEFKNIKNKQVIVGFEIKSDMDTLTRLEGQLRGYLKYCNYVFVLTTAKHKENVSAILKTPEFDRVGIQILDDRTCKLESFKVAKYRNLSDDKLSTGWITCNNNLYSWIYWLNKVWGIEL